MQRPLLAGLAGAAAVLIAAAPAAAAPSWATVPSVDPVATENILTAVSARTATDAWAVGFYRGPNRHDGRIMLAERWDGQRWSQVATPNVTFFDEKLLAVHASSATDAWAVGSTNRTSFASTNPIAAHWNGAAWTIVPTPATTGTAKSILDGVVDFGPANAWAVGRGRDARALVEHWDGTAWTMVPTPNPVPPAGTSLAGSSLTGLTALSPTDMWAVGTFNVAHGTVVDTFTLTEHFNGTAWTIVPSPNPARPHPLNGARQLLNAVSAVSGTDVWAVGETIDTASGSFLPDKTLILHWNGRTWAVVPSPDHLAEDELRGVAAVSATDVWAVGLFVDRGSDGTAFPVGKSQILHWNGTAWSLAASPASPFGGEPVLAGASRVPGSTEVWAAGDTLTAASTHRTFIVHHAA
jgi:hypothetical protein